ncbi:MAG TPA: hypothetical protein VMN81_03425 [Vicinamibacterales bacterium]|nr:hypothetical protein [Vicinamibacterales bacterium]
MEQAHILFPDLPSEPVAARVVQFQPRQAARAVRDPRRLSGDGLAQRLRRDVQRQIDHRRRMLAHLEAQSQA